MKAKRSGKPELQPHQPGQHQRHQADPDRGDRVLDGDDLGVLAPDVLADEGLRVVELDLCDFRRRREVGFVVRDIGMDIADAVRSSALRAQRRVDVGNEVVDRLRRRPASRRHQRHLRSVDVLRMARRGCPA